MKFLKLLGVMLLMGVSPLFGMRQELRPEPVTIRKLCYHGEYGSGGYYRQWLPLVFDESLYDEEIETPAPIYQPDSLVYISMKVIAQKIDNGEITLEKAKTIVPLDLHPQLEAEVKRLKEVNPNKTRLTPELKQAMEEALADFEQNYPAKE